MEYTLKRVKRSRSIRVRVEPTGEVVVSASPYVPHIMIERFVKQQEAWITRQQNRNKLRTEVFPTFDWENKVVSYLGNLYNIRCERQEVRCKIKKQEIIVWPITDEVKDAPKVLTGWLKREGEKNILDQLPYWADKMSLRYGAVRFRQQKSRWGSCSGQGTLSFNWRLIHFKPAVINYVIIHELAHIKHHDHSRAFWAMVEKYMPQYQDHRNFLKRVQLQLI